MRRDEDYTKLVGQHVKLVITECAGRKIVGSINKVTAEENLSLIHILVRHLCALPMVLRRRTAGAALPWLLLFGRLAMAALRCGMIAFVEVSSFGSGTSTMYLSTVHPLLLLYTYGCLICYRNKGVITE